MSSQYMPAPLTRERREIRLIYLHPGAFGEDIKCTITVASLHENPEYEALSYAWGDPTQRTPIYLNGQKHHATNNLVTALRYLREGIREPRVLWIDALSINQTLDEEKSWHVAIMSSIYASCKTVIIWLGPEMDGNDLEHAGWFSLTRMCPGIDVMMQMTLSLLSELAQDKHLEDIQLLDFREGEWDPWDDDPSLALQGINVLLHRPWWERVWVIQEAVIPSKTVVTTGYLQLDWKHFMDAAQNFFKHSTTCCRQVQARIKGNGKSYLEHFHNAVEPIAVLRIKRQIENPSPEYIPDFLEIFYGFCDRRATFAKDKIFSLFGLLKESDSVIQHVPVNYSVNEADLCRQVTVALLKNGSLDVLIGDQSVKSLSNLPSWVKDFTITLSYDHKYKEWNRQAHQKLFHPYQALQTGSGASNPEPKFLANNVLSLRGVHLDTIATVVGKPYPERLVLDTEYAAYWLIALEDSVDDSSNDYSNTFPIKVNEDQNLKEAFWRTMLGEHTRAIIRGPSSISHVTASAEGTTADTKGFADATPGGQGSMVGLGHVGVRRLGRGDIYNIADWLPTVWQNPKHANLNMLEEAMLTTVLGRSFVIGQNGHFGLVPKESQVGDEIWVLQGGRLPFVIRKEKDGNEGPKRLIGEGFFHGIIDGEVTMEDGNTWKEVLLC